MKEEPETDIGSEDTTHPSSNEPTLSEPSSNEPSSSKPADVSAAHVTTARKTGFILISLTVALVAFGIGRWTGGEPAEAGATAAEAEQKSTVYSCPMHPDVRSDDPDEPCPICGMDLVPMDDMDDSGGSDIPALRLSDRAMEVAKVRTDLADRRQLSRDIRAYGRVEVAEEAETDLTAWVRGRIEHLDIRATGQRIRAGQRIARLYSPTLENVQRDLFEALRAADGSEADTARKRLAKASVEAARSRLRVLGLRPAQIDKIIEERKVQDTVSIYADTAGTVRMRHAFEGDWVDVGDSIASLQGLDTVWIQLEIYERDLPFIEEGTPVTVTLPSRPNVEIGGRIDFIDPVVDPKTGTARARVVASNQDGKLRPGSDVRATVEAVIDGDPPPVSVPESSVLWTGPRSVVYRYDRTMDPPAFVANEVELGPKAGQRRVILKGLSEGDEIAVSGAFRIDAELQIKGSPSMMTGIHPAHRIAEAVEVPEGGKEFDPPVKPEALPEGVWYCPMSTVHWAQPTEGDDKCPICGMGLDHWEGPDHESDDHEGHDHAGDAADEGGER